MSLIVIGSSVALSAIVSLCTLAAFISYTLPIGSFLWYRITHADTIEYGPWRLGMWGIPINIFALGWCIFFVAILPFPSVMPVKLETMNYAGPITLAIFSILTVDWIVRARRSYYGPRIEITVDAQEAHEQNLTQETVVAKV